MPDEVWPHDPNEWLPLSSFNGIGFTFRGSTRPDESGRYFATRWFVLLGLPLAPMDRFYLRKASTETVALGYKDRYVVDGESRLNAGEVLRTYLFGWIGGPAVIVLPTLALFYPLYQFLQSIAPDAAWVVLVMIGVFVVGLTCSGLLLGVLIANYRKKWAPLRTVRWVEAPPSPFEDFGDFE